MENIFDVEDFVFLLESWVGVSEGKGVEPKLHMDPELVEMTGDVCYAFWGEGEGGDGEGSEVGDEIEDGDKVSRKAKSEKEDSSLERNSRGS